MKKPINKFAVAMWVAAAIVALISVAQVYLGTKASFLSFTNGDAVNLWAVRGFLAAITGTIAPVMYLVGFGTVLEMVDQIRWDAKNRN